MTSYITDDIFLLSPPQQTLKAWGPLWDCVTILFQFQHSEVADGEQELPELRIYWVAGLALLRAVGHVLAKVDAKTSSKHADAVGELWKNFHSDRARSAIFWDFIERERNNVLKTYSFGARLEWDEDGCAFIGFEDSLDAFQLFREAVYWWRHHLMALERELAPPVQD